ncbi:MAG: sulfatase-like hydrolase/transferase [Phycisphaerales bacterium]|nr:MAG: sulfatase-like hydrolase/transferase [Phycisphaerales bacterium]
MTSMDAGKHTRRNLLKMLGAAAGTLMVPSAAFGSRSSARKPNVVLIFTDDQGSIDVNCYGAEDLYTENLDRLAAQGTRFTQFYVGAAVCSPSRAALLTGRYPRRAGLLGNAPSHKGRKGMPSEQVTIAEMMKAAGYRTGHVGKWLKDLKQK